MLRVGGPAPAGVLPAPSGPTRGGQPVASGLVRYRGATVKEGLVVVVGEGSAVAPAPSGRLSPR